VLLLVEEIDEELLGKWISGLKRCWSVRIILRLLMSLLLRLKIRRRWRGILLGLLLKRG
jgi:hypothetical protein